jgi:hypothetical protein
MRSMTHPRKSRTRKQKKHDRAEGEAFEGVLRRVAEWSNHATPEQLTEFVVDSTRGLVEADDHALAAYRDELERQGVSAAEREERLQKRFSRLYDDRQRKIDTLTYFLRTAHEANKRGN